jgi:uncharacterized coiled-coil protein SlyX
MHAMTEIALENLSGWVTESWMNLLQNKTLRTLLNAQKL